jgi:hypothetical protein
VNFTLIEVILNSGHFADALSLTINGIESLDDFFQFIHAKPVHNALHAKANDANPYPKGRDMNNTAGLKMKATASKATVVVYPVPVGFWDSNIATSWLLGDLRTRQQVG